MKKPSLSFFCPAYFDEANLPLLIPKVYSILKEETSAFEIVIIEDGSPDNTGIVADELELKFKPFVKVIHHKKNLGYGGALKSGYANAKKYDFVFYTDGDNQYDVDEVVKMIPYLSEYDAVIGYRTKRALKLTRQIQTRVFNWLIRLLFKLEAKDINCAMKIVSRKALDKISLTTNGGFIDAELLIKLQANNFKIKQVEVTHYPRKYGKASGGSIKLVLKTLFDVARFYFSPSLRLK